MAFKYRVEVFEDGDVIEPDHWNRNQAVFADEFNGRLDRDNIPEQALDEQHIKANACSQVGGDRRVTQLSLTNEDSRWVDGTGSDINSVTFDAPSSGVLEVEWGGTWNWPDQVVVGVGTVSISASGPAIGFRLLVNGLEIGRAPKSWYQRCYDSVYIHGVTTVTQGPVEIKVQAKRYWIAMGAGTFRTDEQCDIEAGEIIFIYHRR